MISAIILTWNSEEYIEDCLTSLFSDVNLSGEDMEIFVVDNGSTDNTREILASFSKDHPNLNVISNKKNRGTTITRNLVIRKSSGEKVLFLDSDTKILPGTIDILTNTLRDNERVGIAAPRLRNTDRSVQLSCKHFPTLTSKLTRHPLMERISNGFMGKDLYDLKIYAEDFSKTIEVDYCISAAWMISREAINQVGLLDENIFYSPEDVDYCLRMKLNGWRVLYNPDGTVIHAAQRASYKNPRIAISHLKGLYYFFRKYGYWFDREKIYERIKSEGGKSNK